MISFPRGTEMFQFPRCPLTGLCDSAGVHRHHPGGVAPFGHPRINACWRLPEAFRSVATSFLGSWRQGIHRAPLLACAASISRTRQADRIDSLSPHAMSLLTDRSAAVDRSSCTAAHRPRRLPPCRSPTRGARPIAAWQSADVMEPCGLDASDTRTGRPSAGRLCNSGAGYPRRGRAHAQADPLVSPRPCTRMSLIPRAGAERGWWSRGDSNP